MPEDINILKEKFNFLLKALEEFGYKLSDKLGQKELRIFLNKRTSSGQFDPLLCNKLFQVLNIGEKTVIPLVKFCEGFLIFEEEILRNAETFRIELAKEQEIYNKIIRQCEIYKSENLTEEGFCKNAKIYGEITDINIKKKLEGINEIIMLVIFNDKKEEFHFKIGYEANNIKKKFQFKPTSRKDHFEFIMKGINNKGAEFAIGSKIFPLSDIVSQEEYFVQIIVPEIDEPDKVAAYINGTILLYMSDFKYYEDLRKKQERRLKKYQIAANKANDYLKYVREIYGDITLMKRDIVVDYNNEKLMQRRGAKLDININNQIEVGAPIRNYYVEYNNERQIKKLSSPLKVEFNNIKPNLKTVVETKKVEYDYKINYNISTEKNIISSKDQQNKQILQTNEKKIINTNNIQPPAKSDNKAEENFFHIGLFSDRVKEENDFTHSLNNLNINQKSKKINSKEQKIIELQETNHQIKNEVDLTNTIPYNISGEKTSKQINVKETGGLSPDTSQPMQNIQTNQNIFYLDSYIKQKYNINNITKINQNINTNTVLNNQHNLSNVPQNLIQEYNTSNLANTTKTTTTVVQKSQNQLQPQLNNIENVNVKKIEKNNENKAGHVTELERASIYQVVGDISKKDTVMSNPQNLETIIKKPEYNFSVNKAIINETTNKVLVTENTLPVSYFPEKVNKLIISDQVTYLPLATTQKKVTYNTLKPISHQSQVYIKEGKKNIINSLENNRKGQSIIRVNNNNSQFINNNINYNYANNQTNTNTYLNSCYNINGENIYNYNLNSNNVNLYKTAQSNKTTNITIKRLEPKVYPAYNSGMQTQVIPFFNNQPIKYGL